VLTASRPVQETGTYTWHGVGLYMLPYVAQWPVPCWFNLRPFRGTGIIYQGNFTLASTTAPGTTWQMQPTITTSRIPVTIPSPSGPSTSNPAQAGRSGLSTGAKAGTGVGVAVGALLALGMIIYCFAVLRRRSRREEERRAAPTWVKPELPVHEGKHQRHESDARSIHEIE
jgi:hypothetical protein